MRLAIDSRLEEVRRIGSQVKAFCLEQLVKLETAEMVELAVVEAVNNVVKHAYLNQPGNKVEVDLESFGNRLVFTIRNWGQPLIPRGAPKLEFDPKDVCSLPEGGMGLFIISQVMDKVEFSTDHGTNTLSLTKFKDAS